MEFVVITTAQFDELVKLHTAYKAEIGEDIPTESNLESLKNAIQKEHIHFFGCFCENELVACCSLCSTYSTFNYEKSGVFEDFYIKPEYRHKGIARKLISFAHEKSQVHSLSVGCADCDLEMYKALGFRIPLGNMLARTR